MTRFSPLTAMAVGLALFSQLALPLSGLAEQDKPVYPELKTASGLNRTFQAMTGFTPLSGLIANRLLKRELQRHVQGSLHSRLTLFSGSDLLGARPGASASAGKT